MSFEQARELLSDAVRADEGAGVAPLSGGSNGPGPSVPPSSNQEPATPQVETDAGATQEDSFTGFDPAALPEDLQEVYKSMQRDYTRKTQELAEQRKAFEAIDDPNAAAEALQFVQALQTDPNYAMQVHAALTQELQSAGLSPYEAHQAATDAMQGGGEDALWPDSGDESGFIPPEVARELSEMKQWRQQMEEERLQMQWETELMRQTQAIQQQHPEYGENELKAIYDLAWSTQGDLFKAQETYENIVNSRLQSYYNQKASVPAGSPASTAGSAEEPRSFQTLDEAHAGGAKEAYLRYLQED